MEKEEKKKAYFKELCFEYLIQLSLVDLRAYGRFLKLPRPTYLKKEELINEILSVLCGEKNPTRTQRGAPIKNNWFSTEIPSVIEKLKRKAFGEELNLIQKKKTKREKEKISIQRNSVLLQFSIAVEKLNHRQKQLLNDFLNSL